MKGSFNVFHAKFSVPLIVTVKDTKLKILTDNLYIDTKYSVKYYCLNVLKFLPLDFLKGIKDQINAEPFRNSCELTAGDSVSVGTTCCGLFFF